jgi:hypothetical protein
MNYTAVLKCIEGDKGIIRFEGGSHTAAIPLKYLPKHCREGDVMQITIQFDPFKSLEYAKNE